MRLLGSSRQSAPELAVLDVAGHSLTTTGYVERFARSRGANVLRHLGMGGAMAHMPSNTTTTGMGGWGWVVGSQYIHRAAPRQGWPGQYGGYLPPRSASILHFGLNDLASLGSTNSAPWIAAMRSMISQALTVVSIDPIGANATRTGSGWATAGLGGYSSGPIANYANTATAGDYIEFAVPSTFPGGRVALPFVLHPSHDLTITITVDGSSTPIRLTGSTLCSQQATPLPAVKHNLCTHRTVDLAPGAHTIRATLTTQHVAGSAMLIDGLHVEAQNDIAPVVVVPGMHRPQSYTIWSTWNGYASMTDQTVMEWDTALRALVAEFGPSVVYADIDSAISKSAAFHSSDGAHLNSLGDQAVGEAVIAAFDTAWNTRRALATSTLGAEPRTRFFGLAGQPSAFLGTWVQGGTPSVGGNPFIGLSRELDGKITLSGRASGGANGDLFDLPTEWRPHRLQTGVAFSDAGGQQRIVINPDTGRVNIAAGYAANTTILPMTWYASAPVLVQ